MEFIGTDLANKVKDIQKRISYYANLYKDTEATLDSWIKKEILYYQFELEGAVHRLQKYLNRGRVYWNDGVSHGPQLQSFRLVEYTPLPNTRPDLNAAI